jgi:hypothetical protein
MYILLHFILIYFQVLNLYGKYFNYAKNLKHRIVNILYLQNVSLINTYCGFFIIIKILYHHLRILKLYNNMFHLQNIHNIRVYFCVCKNLGVYLILFIIALTYCFG